MNITWPPGLSFNFSVSLNAKAEITEREIHESPAWMYQEMPGANPCLGKARNGDGEDHQT